MFAYIVIFPYLCIVKIKQVTVMTNKETIKKRFISSNTKMRKDGSIRTLASFREKYGDMSLDDAFELFYAEVTGFLSLKDKIKEFENFLRNEVAEGRCVYQESRISESRYYRWNGTKYRFSSHVYPTGSMTDEVMRVVDFAANPELINNVKY